MRDARLTDRAVMAAVIAVLVYYIVAMLGLAFNTD